MRELRDSKTNQLASKHLGSSGSYDVQSDTFLPELLVAIPRWEARKDWGITGNEFVGYDIWHCHESTFLLNNGFPVAGTLKVRIPSYSKCIVESKSFKLFLNSFDMCKMGKDTGLATLNYETKIKDSLEDLLQCDIEVKFHHVNCQSELVPGTNPFTKYIVLEQQVSINKLQEFNDYTAMNDYPIVMEGFKDVEYSHYYRQTNVLRSRCRHTKQKDTGTFFTMLGGNFLLSEVDLLKKVVSLRMLDEFHEFCCEKLFVDFVRHKEIEQCMVALLYSRRGSLDINPIRATSFELIPEDYVNVNIYSKKTFGQ